MSAAPFLVAPESTRSKNNDTPIMKVHIDQHFSAKVYTSGSTITGHVYISCSRDTQFGDVQILFTGIAATRLDFVQQYPKNSLRPFMKIRMPIQTSDFPEDRVFRAKQDYKIPFHFVVPHQLTISACNHKVESNSVREQHLRLPPSLGSWEANDQAPDMTKIEYAIKARAVLNKPGGLTVKIMEGFHTLKVIPSLPEDAPLDITLMDERYKLSKTKTIRKSLFSGKTGQLTASATQPGAVVLSADGHKASSTSVRIKVDYLPSSAETAPPKINSVTGKLISMTFFSAAPVQHLPNLGNRDNCGTTTSLSYTNTNSLFTVPVDSVSWMQQNASSFRRDSGYSSTLADEDASGSDVEGSRPHLRGYSGSNGQKPKGSSIKHTTDIEIPFSIPCSNQKLFLPTFHSCLISRSYTLQLNLSVGPTNTTVSLAIPLQISVENIYDPQGFELPSFETAVAAAEQDEADSDAAAYRQPGILPIPDVGEQSSNLPPDYYEFRRRIVSVA